MEFLVVVCGNIARILDQDRVGSNLPYTHAGVYSYEERFSLVASLEPDKGRRMKFMTIQILIKSGIGFLQKYFKSILIFNTPFIL